MCLRIVDGRVLLLGGSVNPERSMGITPPMPRRSPPRRNLLSLKNLLLRRRKRKELRRAHDGLSVFFLGGKEEERSFV